MKEFSIGHHASPTRSALRTVGDWLMVSALRHNGCLLGGRVNFQKHPFYR